MTMELAGERPPRYGKKTALHRRARALGCQTRIRAGFPRHRSRNPTIAGDRPPRYGKIETGRALLHGFMKHPHFTIVYHITSGIATTFGRMPETFRKTIETRRSLLPGPESVNSKPPVRPMPIVPLVYIAERDISAQQLLEGIAFIR